MAQAQTSPADPAFAAACRRGEQALPESRSLGLHFPDYRPILDWPGERVDAGQRALAELPVDGGLLRGAVPGFLRPADALALYELAYWAKGDVLELGSYLGLSTTILCQALRSAGRGNRVCSVEIEPVHQRATLAAVVAQGLDDQLAALPGDADKVLARLDASRRTFSLIFVDHDHRYPATRRVGRRLTRLLRPGGIAVFHDFNDARNVTEPASYGVYRAVVELLRRPELSFLGVVGCCGLMRWAGP